MPKRLKPWHYAQTSRIGRVRLKVKYKGDLTIGRFRGVPDRNKRDAHRINDKITETSVRVIDAEGNQLGVIKTKDAILQAKNDGLDLVEVSPNAKPPVCKILDYGKFKFQEQKRASEARKKQQVVSVKEIPIRPRTEDHDYNIKLRKARQFLEAGHKVKFNLRFKGREVAHHVLGKQMLDRIRENLSNMAKVDFQSGLEGRFMSLIVSSDKKKMDALKAAEAKEAETAASEEEKAEE